MNRSDDDFPFDALAGLIVIGLLLLFVIGCTPDARPYVMHAGEMMFVNKADERHVRCDGGTLIVVPDGEYRARVWCF